MFVTYLIVAFMLSYFIFNNISYSILISLSGAILFLIIYFIFDKINNRATK